MSHEAITPCEGDNLSGGDVHENVDLTMLHLRKLFEEFINLKTTLSDHERDTRLYQMLPLYCNVAKNAKLMNDKSQTTTVSSHFLSWEGQAAFCHHISRLLAREIKVRALNRSTETASKTIASFLEHHDVQSSDESGNGSVLLTAVNLMASTTNNSSLQEIMINAALPSTLVRCIYLFLDLPEAYGKTSSSEDALQKAKLTSNSLFTAFSQILLKLCAHPLAAEELIRVDDLSLLFSTVTAQYGPCNLQWRSLASDILDTLGRHGLTDAVIEYVHVKGCMALCVDNMQRSLSYNPFDIVEMLLSICGFLQQSSRYSQKLMDDFKECQGYLFLIDCLLKINHEIQTQEKNDATMSVNTFQKLIHMMVSLCYCGYAHVQSLHMIDFSKAQFQMQEFRVPERSSKAACLRNIHAFMVLQTVFLRSENVFVCDVILDSIQDIYKSDNVNYFMVESQNTLCLFAEKIHLKPRRVQEKFFELIEFIVFQLNFIPRKELISLSILLKTNQDLSTSIACTRLFLRLLRHNSIFVDVYRETGVLEVFVTCIKRYKDYLEKQLTKDGISCNTNAATVIIKSTELLDSADEQEILCDLVMEAVVRLLNGSCNNTSIFKSSGGNKCIYALLKYKYNSASVLKIVKELVVTVGSEDDMLQLLKTINLATEQHSTNVLMCIHVLQTLIECLRESHRTRSIFRKVSGFVYVVNVLDLLKNKFGNSQSCNAISRMHIQLFLVVCRTLSAAMRFEPANAKYFQNEVANSLFLESIRSMGCFSRNQSIKKYSSNREVVETCRNSHQDSSIVDQTLVDAYASIFKTAMNHVELLSDDVSVIECDTIPSSLRFVCIIYRILYGIVLDGFEGPQTIDVLHHLKSITDVASESSRPGTLGSTVTSSTVNDNLIVHPSVILCMLKLLPSIEEPCILEDDDKTISWKSFTTSTIALQVFLGDLIKSFVRSERNQQIMCDSGLNEYIIRFCKEALVDEQHPLHVSLQYIFERLAVQALMSKELRNFLRLGLKFSKDNNSDTSDDFIPPVPLTRVKTLVSITTPRDFRSQGSSTMPPFIELDMSTEGFACLFFPNIAPNHLQYQSTAHHHLHSPVTTGISNSATAISGLNVSSFPGFQTNIIKGNGSGPQMEPYVGGGIGSGDRPFPSPSGLTYSTWFCVERYPQTHLADGNPIRLLHIVRSDDSSSEDPAIIFSILILPSDKSLSVATQEFPFSQEYSNIYKDELLSRVWCPTFIRECQWHHVAVTLGKITPKSSLVTIYLDGRHVHSQKINPISSTWNSSSRNQTSCVHAFVGTPPIWRKYSKLVWKQGACNLMDDSIDAAAVARIFMLGPHYLGSFQDVRLDDNEEINPLIMEEKIAFSVNPRAHSYMTLNKIRKVYNRTDAKAIGKQLGMSSHENATPIIVLHNAAGHLNGPARSLGGVLVGYLGIRKFNPFPVSMTINTIGGCSVLLGLVAMSRDIESLYAAVKALTCILRTSKLARQEMNQRRFYQTLGMLFKRKKTLLNSHILHLTFNLVGTVHSGHETSTIPNITGFQDLLCDFPIWLDHSNDLIRSLLEHLLELCTESNEKLANIRVMQDLQCVSKLLYIIEDITDVGAENALFALIQILLSHQTRSVDLLLFGQYIASCTKKITSDQFVEKEIDRQVHLRNRGLSILHHLHYGTNNIINWRFCDEMSRILGLEWVLLLMQPHLHSTSVVWAFRLLVTMLTRESILSRFREGKCTNGEDGYLKNTEIIMLSRNAILLSAKVPSQVLSASSGNNVTEENCTFNQVSSQLLGFSYLEWLLMHRTNVSEVFSLLIALIVGYPVKSLIEPSRNYNLESIWSFLWSTNSKSGSSAPEKITCCSEAVCILLALTRSVVHCKNGDQHATEENDACSHWLQDHPSEILTLFMSFYRHIPDFVAIAMSGEVIASLIAIQFAPSSVADFNKQSSSLDHSPRSTAEVKNLQISIEPSFASVPSSPDNTTQERELHCDTMWSNEPITEQVMAVLQAIISDSLFMVHSSKPPPVIDLILDFYITGINISHDQRKKFLTEMIMLLMTNAVLINAIDGQVDTSLNNNQIKLAGQDHLVANVFYVTARFVDKLWQRMLLIDGREIFDLCVSLLNHVKRNAARTFSSTNTVASISGNGCNTASASSLDSLYRSLNRCILYLLAYPPAPANTTLVEILQKLMYNRLLVFGAGNHDPDFIGCLAYCILQVHKGKSVTLSSPAQFEQERTTTWHVEEFLDNKIEEIATTNLQRYETAIGSSSELENISFRVWEELYVCKKPVIEEVFKVTLAQPLHNSRAPNIESTHDQIHDVALKHWLAYVEGEKRSVTRNPWDVHNSIQSRIQKVTGGLTRLTSRTKLKKEVSKRRGLRIDEYNFETNRQGVNAKIALIQEFWNFTSTQYGNNYMHTKRYVYQDWLQVEAELIRERAIWGPECCAEFTKWTLDNTEGPYRMRKKMLKNVFFYLHYPPRADLEDHVDSVDHVPQRQTKSRVASSYDSAKYSKFVRIYRTMFPEQFEQDVTAVDGSSRNESSKKSEYSKPSRVHSDEKGYCLENEEDLSLSLPDSQILLRLLEDKEKVSNIFRTARIQGLDTFEGLLLFGRECCYIVDGFTLLCNREIHDIDSLPAESFDPILPSTTSGNCQTARNIRQCSKIFYEDIREIHKRRYLLQPIALEIFCGNGQNYLLSFPQKVRNKVYQKVSSMATHIADNAQQSVAGQKRAASVEQTTGLLSSLIGETSVTQRWVRGEISNFQYLMHLNSLAGRSYNDLMQYPVFPWILSNYDCETLDLNDPSNFRDLSKPMGAQTQERLEQFLKRYKDWDDPQGDTPPYHYGTHYSSAMIICSYLIRLEPFTQHFLRLQGGHFDLADRMFHSVKEAWYSASRQNMADVKELIPEFFYLPEFLENSNRFDLGTKQNGEVLNHVVLPPWAKNDPREFIRMHREALECDYVSRHLHLWIDLIFGYKQQGQAAIDAVNVFHHLFYEGNVDIYNIEDPLQKSAAIGFINNFGQIPKQLFRKQHPAKRMTSTKQFSMLVDVSPLIPPQSPIGSGPAINFEKIFFYRLNNLKSSQQPIKELKGPVGQILQHEKQILSVEQNKTLLPKAYNRYIAWGFADHSLRVGCYDSGRIYNVWENVDICGEILTCTCPSAKVLIIAGTSSVLSVYNIDTKMKKISLKQTLYGHTDAVTALTSSTAYNIIISGSRDQSAIIWDLARLTYVRQLTGHVGVVAAVSINELTGDIATCSGTWLHIWSINGLQLAVVNTSMGSSDRMQQILCVAFSSTREWDTSNVIITGSTDGVVRLWSIEFLKNQPQKKSAENASNELLPVTSGARDNNPQSSQSNGSWERKLVFRTELTMHTAYDCKNNIEPASITALAISKDHHTLYIGDARGRIYAWYVADSSSNQSRIASGFVPQKVNKCSSLDN